MDKRELIVANAIGSDGFQSTATAAGYVNPTYWNRQVLSFLEEKLVVANKAKVYNDLLGQDGATLNVTIDVAPTAASAVAESADVTVTAQDFSQVTFTPTEYAKAFQLSDKEARRSFLDQMQNMSKKIGYSLALARDDAAVTLLQASAGNTVNANNVVTSAITTTDTLDYDDVVNCAVLLQADYLTPVDLIVSPAALGQLAKAQQFSYVDNAGSSETLRNGRIGRIYGLDVWVTTQITATSSKAKAIMLGVDGLGEPSFGICHKSMPTIATERHELGRYTDIVGVEEWDVEVLRANGIGTIQHYQ